MIDFDSQIELINKKIKMPDESKRGEEALEASASFGELMAKSNAL